MNIVTQTPTTAKQILRDLTETVPICLISLCSKLSYEELTEAAMGKSNGRTFVQLIRVWATISANQEKDAELSDLIQKDHMREIFFSEYENGDAITDYADKHGE